MKKVVLAFDSFKGCISAREACEACAQGVCEAWQDAVIVQIPLSDGGRRTGGVCEADVAHTERDCRSTRSSNG